MLSFLRPAGPRRLGVNHELTPRAVKTTFTPMTTTQNPPTVPTLTTALRESIASRKARGALLQAALVAAARQGQS